MATVAVMAGGLVIAASVAASGGSDSAATASVPARLQGIPTNKVGPAEGQVRIDGTVPPELMEHLESGRRTPAPPPPNVCSAAVSAMLSAAYGELRTCLLAGTTWVVATLGFPGTTPRQGVLLLYRCSGRDTACLDERASYPLSNWQVVRPPYPAPISVLQDGVDGSAETLLLADGPREVTFNVSTGRFGTATPGLPGYATTP